MWVGIFAEEERLKTEAEVEGGCRQGWQHWGRRPCFVIEEKKKTNVRKSFNLYTLNLFI